MLTVMCVAMMISGCSDKTVPVEEDQNSSDVITELSDLRDFTALSSLQSFVSLQGFKEAKWER